jgi:hypothetical protein
MAAPPFLVDCANAAGAAAKAAAAAPVVNRVRLAGFTMSLFPEEFGATYSVVVIAQYPNCTHV